MTPDPPRDPLAEVRRLRAMTRLTLVKSIDAFSYWLLRHRRFALANFMHRLARRMTHRRSCRHP